MGRNYNCYTAFELTNCQVSGFVFSWFHENTEKTKASSETVLRLMPLPCHMVASAVSAHLLQLQESASSADPVVPSLLVPGPVKSLYAYCSMASALAFAAATGIAFICLLPPVFHLCVLPCFAPVLSTAIACSNLLSCLLLNSETEMQLRYLKSVSTTFQNKKNHSVPVLMDSIWSCVYWWIQIVLSALTLQVQTQNSHINLLSY